MSPISIGMGGNVIHDHGHVPMPTTARPLRAIPRPRGLDWSKHTAPAPEPRQRPVAIKERARATSNRAASPKAKKRISDERRALIVAAYQDDPTSTWRSLSRRFGHGHSTIGRILAEAGLVNEPRERRDSRLIGPSNMSQIVAAYNAGESVPTLSRATGVSMRAIRRALRRSGIEMRDDRRTRSGGGNRLSRECEGTIVTLYRSGMAVSAIAIEVEVAESSVYRALHRLGEPKRPAPTTVGVDRARDLRTLIAQHQIDLRVVRAWAQANDIPCGQRGLPARAVIEQFLHDTQPKGITA